MVIILATQFLPPSSKTITYDEKIRCGPDMLKQPEPLFVLDMLDERLATFRAYL